MILRRLMTVVAWLLTTSPAWAQVPADAYQDEAARELVAQARARRGIIDLSIQEYRALSTERISAGYRLLRRDRLLFRRETAARVHWRREGATTIEVVGAREVVPIAQGRIKVPDDLADNLPHIAFDPLDSEFLFRIDSTFIRHPLAPGSEQHYRFATGDSTVVRLPDGSAVKLRELRITPRRRDPHLIVGSFWIHTQSFAVVQAAFRLARAYTIADDADADDDVPGFLKSIRADFSHFAVDYGLWELRWWLPRFLAVEGVVEFGALGTMPMQYERSYTDYEVTADSTRQAPRTAQDSAAVRCGRASSFSLSIEVNDDSVAGNAETERLRARLRERSARQDTTGAECRRRFVVSIPDSVANLLESPHLPASIYGDSPVLSELELEQLAQRVRNLPLPPWQLGGMNFDWGLGGSGLARYNRVEALGLGLRGTADFGRAHGSLETSYGIADEWPKAELRFGFDTWNREYQLAAYRGLRATDAAANPFSFANSVTALLLGRDDGLYYRAAGAALTVAPTAAKPQWYRARLYAERQTATKKNTDFSVPHLFDGSFEFRENIVADRATQYGAELALRADFGENPNALRAGGQVEVRAETGTYEFVRPALTVHAMLPPLGSFALGMEAAAGTTFQTSSTQSLWYLGGTNTLRGYAAGDRYGPAFWRVRGEIATALPLVRLALFTDAGWAGSSEGDAWRREQPLLSAGAGLSLLDGIVRFDVARALRAPTGWRVHLYMDGVL